MIILFNHIPKTGGHTVAKTLSERFQLLYDYVPDAFAESFQRWRTRPLSSSRVHDGVVLLGHFTGDGCRPAERYPGLLRDSRVRLITFLRNPTELALSRYFYCLRQGECSEADFRDVLFEMAGVYSGVFAGDAGSRYAFVGITEQMTVSLSLLAQMLQVDLPLQSVGRENATQRLRYPPGWQVTMREFEEASLEDHRLYRAACERLSELAAS